MFKQVDHYTPFQQSSCSTEWIMFPRPEVEPFDPVSRSVQGARGNARVDRPFNDNSNLF